MRASPAKGSKLRGHRTEGKSMKIIVIRGAPNFVLTQGGILPKSTPDLSTVMSVYSQAYCMAAAKRAYFPVPTASSS